MDIVTPPPTSPFRPRVVYGILAVLFVAHYLVTAAVNPYQGLGMLLNTPGYCVGNGPSEAMRVGSLCVSSACWAGVGAALLRSFKRERSAVLVTALIAVACGVLVTLIHFNTKRLDAEAAALTERAKQSIPIGTPAADCRKWLRENGYFIFNDTPALQNEPNTEINGRPAVQGLRPLSEHRTAGGEAWMELIFYFSEDGRCVEIEGGARGYPITPAFRSAMKSAGYLK